jgi:hypothetical protein
MMQKCSVDLPRSGLSLLLGWPGIWGGALARPKGVHIPTPKKLCQHLMLIKKRCVKRARLTAGYTFYAGTRLPPAIPALLSTACSKTLAPASAHAGEIASPSLWLSPPTHGMKIMPVGATRAT